jgi:hypothetical protein
MNGLMRALATAQTYAQPVKLDSEAQEDLVFWVELSALWNGKGIIDPIPDLSFTTDASPFGWGGWFQPTASPMVTIQGRFLKLHKLDSTNGMPPFPSSPLIPLLF